MLALVGQGMLADEIHLQRFIGGSRHERRFGQQLDLQRHEVAEYPRQGNDDIDPGTSQILERDQRCPGNAAIAVKTRQRTHQGKCLADRRTLALEVVAAPEHHRNGLGQGVAIGDEAVEQDLGVLGAIPDRKSAGYAERIEAVDIASGGQHFGRAQQVATGSGPDIAAIERVQQGVHFGILAQAVVGGSQRLHHGQRIIGFIDMAGVHRRLYAIAGHEFFHRRSVELHAVRRIGHGQQHVHAFGMRQRAAGHMQSMRDQGVFELEHLLRELHDAGVGISGRGQIPGRFGVAQVELGRLSLDEQAQFRALMGVRIQGAPPFHRRLEVVETLVQSGLRHWRGEIADQRCTGPALGDGALRRVIGCIQIDVGQVIDQAVGPAGATHAALLARHEFQCPVRAEMQHRVRLEVLAQVAIESRESVGGRQAFFKQQAHGVALVPEGRLDGNEHIAELLAEHENGAAVAQLLARCAAPLRFDLLEPAFAPHVIVGGDERVHIGVGAVLQGIAVQDSVAQRIDIFRDVHPVSLRLHGSERVHQRLKNRQIRGAADIAGIGREIENHHRYLALGTLAALERDELGDTGGQHESAFRARAHVLRGVGRLKSAGVIAAGAGHAGSARPSAEDDGTGRAVQLGDGHHDGALYGQQAALGTAPLVQGLELHGMGCNVRNIQVRQHFLGSLGIVVRRPTHQGEAAQRHHGIDDHLASVVEICLDCRARIQPCSKGGNHAQALGLQRGDDAVVVRRVSGQ